ncbi:MAG: MFS transporter, partial [Selenomonas bovis]
SALIGCAQMILGGVMMPVVGIAGDQTAVPMGIIMCIGYLLANAAFYHFIASEHRGERKRR